MTDPRQDGWRQRDGWRPPPDAGTSYLGTYGIAGNPWLVWMLNGDGESVMQSLPQFRAAPRAPWCPDVTHSRAVKMNWRPGAWKCYLHDTPVVIEIQTKLPRAPKGDVLKRLGDVLDYRWNDQEQRFEVVALEVQSLDCDVRREQ